MNIQDSSHKHARAAVLATLSVMLILLSSSGCDTSEVVVEAAATSAPAPGDLMTPITVVERAARATPTFTLSPIPTPSLPTPSPTPYTAGWQTCSNPAYAISLRFPAHWEPELAHGLPELGDTKYAGDDGFFIIQAEGGAGIDAIAAAIAGHRLRPYGSQPTIEKVRVQRQEARLILPSADQHPDMRAQAELIIRYPQPVSIGRHAHPAFSLVADQDHIWAIARTLRFTTEEGSAQPERNDQAPLPMPADVLSDTYASYVDTDLDLSLRTPLGWETDSAPGAATHSCCPDRSGTRESMLTLSLLSPESNTLESALEENVHAIAFSPDGSAWIATDFNLYHLSQRECTVYGSKVPTALAAAPDSTLWVAYSPFTGGELSAFDGHVWITYTESLPVEPPVTTLAVTGNGAVWAGAGHGGLARFDDQSWDRHTAIDGLVSDRIVDLVVAPDDVLWAITDESPAYFMGDTWESVWLGRDFGTTNAIAFAPDSSIWLGTSKGAIHFQPQQGPM